MTHVLDLLFELLISGLDLFECGIHVLLLASTEFDLEVFSLDGDVHIEVLVALQCFDHVLLCVVVEYADQQQVRALDDDLAQVAEGVLLSIGDHFEVVKHGRRGTPRLHLLQCLVQRGNYFSELCIEVLLDCVQVFALELCMHLLLLFFLLLTLFLLFTCFLCKLALIYLC